MINNEQFQIILIDSKTKSLEINGETKYGVLIVKGLCLGKHFTVESLNHDDARSLTMGFNPLSSKLLRDALSKSHLYSFSYRFVTPTETWLWGWYSEQLKGIMSPIKFVEKTMLLENTNLNTVRSTPTKSYLGVMFYKDCERQHYLWNRDTLKDELLLCGCNKRDYFVKLAKTRIIQKNDEIDASIRAAGKKPQDIDALWGLTLRTMERIKIHFQEDINYKISKGILGTNESEHDSDCIFSNDEDRKNQMKYYLYIATEYSSFIKTILSNYLLEFSKVKMEHEITNLKKEVSNAKAIGAATGKDVFLAMIEAQKMTPKPPTPPDYLFKKDGDFWKINFAGVELPPIRGLTGMKYIHALLKERGKRFSPSELYQIARPLPPEAITGTNPETSSIIENYGTGGGRAIVLDQKGIVAINRRIADIIEDLKDNELSLETREEMQEEHRKLKAALAGSTKKTFEAKEIKQPRQAVTKAIEKAVDAIADSGKAGEKLSRDLRNTIKKGNTFNYDGVIEWQFS